MEWNEVTGGKVTLGCRLELGLEICVVDCINHTNLHTIVSSTTSLSFL